MEHLIKNQHSKRANNSIPHVIQVLQEHSERILKLEAMVKIIDVQPVHQELTKEPEVEVVQPNIELEQIKEPEPEREHVVEPVIPNKMIEELTNKISDLANQNVILNDEITTLTTIEEDLDDDVSDIQSVCTEDCRELIEKNADLIKCGSWKVSEQVCNDCVKKQAKLYKVEKQKIEKQRAKQLKEVKQKQKELIKQEQRDLQQKLKNLKKGRDEGYGIDKTKQEQMKAELQRIANEYQKTGNTNATFNVQMFI